MVFPEQRSRFGVYSTLSLVFFTLTICIYLFFFREDEPLLTKADISVALAPSVSFGQFPRELEIFVDGQLRNSEVDYTLEPELQELMIGLFKRYRPDYGAFVALDARTGRILVMTSYVKDEVETNHPTGLQNIALKANFPAASVFKIVTAAAAIDQRKVSSETIIPYNGSNHTLYRRNVESDRETPWTRQLTLREAFGKSVNTVFGKLGLFYVGHHDLSTYAQRFGFNREMQGDFPFETGVAQFSADEPWSVVEAASGFTRSVTMSAVQGALLAGSIANGGVMMEPTLVDRIAAGPEELLYASEPVMDSVPVDPTSASELKTMMEETVQRGTSRSSFRSFYRDRDLASIEIGGKTGSLTGQNPKGKCDWFVGYAIQGGEPIAFAALTVHKTYWTVKSAYLARQFIDTYYKGREPKVFGKAE